MPPSNSLPGAVDVLNRKTGNLVMEYTKESDRVVNLTQSSVVRVHASPDVVGSYERQGNDLIIHMKDGTTVRYQNFFLLDEEGLHSELIFEDQLGVHHAVFPAAAEAGPIAAEAIVPVFSDVALGSLIGASGLSALAALGGIAAIGGVIGVAAAASNSGDSHDNKQSSPTTPTITITPVATDNIINKQEIGSAQTVSGSVQSQFAGSTLTISLNGQTWSTTINADGTWSSQLPLSLLQTLADGTYPLKVSITTPGGSTFTKESVITVDTTPPELTLTPFATGGTVTQAQHDADKIVRGYVDEKDAGATIVVTLNNKQYTAVADGKGQWQLVIPKADMGLLLDGKDYTITYTATDIAGNETSTTATVNTNFGTPKITIDPFTGDNVINGAEVLLNQTLSGHTANIPIGNIVTITLAGKTYYAEVLGDGSWKTTIAAGDLGKLKDPQYTITAKVNDDQGISTDGTADITIDTTQPAIAIAILSTDDYLNVHEAEQPLVVRGVVTAFAPGVAIIVTVNGKTYTVSNIDAAGNWSVTIPSSDLVALKDGPNVITATATLNTDTATDQHTLNVQIHHVPDLVINPLFSDDYLNATEQKSDQILSGNTGVSGPGQSVTVQLGGKPYSATVDGDGTWKVTIPAADLQKLADGVLTVTVNASDASGNTSAASQTVTVDTVAPPLTILPLTGDGKLNGTELTQNQTLSGMGSVNERWQTVTVTLNGKTYTTLIGEDGSWRVLLPSQDLGQLGAGNYPLVATLTDAAGNTTTVTQTVSVKTAPLTVTVQAFTDGNVLDAAEVKADQILRGGSNAEANSTVTVVLNGKSYSTITNASGDWQVTLPAAELQKLADGAQNLTVSITDGYGQSKTVTAGFTVDTNNDALSIGIIASDDYLNASEAGSGLTVRGTSAGLPQGTTITVRLNGGDYITKVGADGSWQIDPIPGSVLITMPDGPQTLTATAEVNGVLVVDSHTFVVAIHSQFNFKVDPLFDNNGILNLVASSQDQTLTGKTGVTGAGQKIVAILNGQQYVGTVLADGSWSIVLPKGAMENLADGPNDIRFIYSDIAGNSGSTPDSFIVDKTPPILTVFPVNATDLLGSNNVSAGISLEVSALPDVLSVYAKINNQNYIATFNNVNGRWEIPIDASVLSTLPNGATTFTVTAQDTAGNTTTVSHTVTVDTVAPNVVIDPVTKDNIVDVAEISTGITLTGKTVPADPGAKVSVIFNGTLLDDVTVGLDGSWSVFVSNLILQGMSKGPHTVQVVVTDLAGNVSQSVSESFNVDTDRSAISISPVEGIDKIGVANIADGLTISGLSSRIPENGVVTITINGVQYTATVSATGEWSTTVPQQAAAAIADGTTTITVSALDVDGNAVSSEHQFTIITHTLPQPAIHLPFGDGVINAAEALVGGSLSGTTGIKGAGQTVTITLDNGTPLNAVVDANGNWTLALTPGQLAALGNGDHMVNVSVTDAVGNQNTASVPLVVDKSAPTVGVYTVTDDNIVNSIEAAGPLTISGTGTYDSKHVLTLVVLVNGQSYDAILQPNGTWSIMLPAGALSGVPDGPVTVKVTATDYAGNSTTTSTSFTLDASPLNAPKIQVDKISTDDYVNKVEAGSDLIISGTTLNVEVGRDVKIIFGGQTYYTKVQAGGTWSFAVPQTDVANVLDGAQVISVSVSDLAGNIASGEHTVTFVAQPASQPTIVINTVAQDDVINALEHKTPLVISGTSTGLATGSVVSVTLNTKLYTASVDKNGNWSLTVPQTDVLALSETSYSISASAVDAAQNPAGTTHSIIVDTSAPKLIVDVASSVFDDGALNIAEAAVDQIIRGTGTAGETVSLTINNRVISALVDSQGNWQMTLLSADLQSLPASATLVFKSADAAGNEATNTVTVNVKTSGGPTITLDTMFTDNIVSIAEAVAGTTLKGSANGLATGTPVTVTIGSDKFYGTVSGNTWTVAVTPGGLKTSGQLDVTVTANDAWGNPATAHSNLDVVLGVPQAKLPGNVFGTDNILSQAEANAGITLTGNTGQSGVGQTVKITLDNSQEFTGTVDINGNWTVVLTPSQLNGIPDGDHQLTLAIGDRAGNKATPDILSVQIYTDPLSPPTLTPPFANGILNAVETNVADSLTGALNIDYTLVKSVVVSINNGPAVAAQVLSNGTWSLPMSIADLKALPDGVLQVNVTVTDIAGNQISGQGSFEVLTHTLPVANYLTPFGDGVINYAETQTDQIIKGSTGVTGAGQSVELTLGGKLYTTGTVDANGNWSVTIPQTDLAAMNNLASLDFSVKVIDRAGNSDTSALTTVTVHSALPSPTVSDPFGDGFINIKEAASAATLTGSTGTVGANQYVTVKVDVNGVLYTANVNSNGTWTVDLPAGALQSLSPGEHQIVIYAQDQYGNSTTVKTPYQVVLTAPSVTITSPIFGDGYVNATEASNGTTLTGTFSSPYPVGASVKVTIGSHTFDAEVTGKDWKLVLTDTDWLGISERGLQNITVSLDDGVHNTSTASATVTLLLDQPTISVTKLFAGDNTLTYAESLSNQIISGTSTHLQKGDTITVTFGGPNNIFTTTVQADGSWSLQLTPAQMALLANGAITVKGTDLAGNSTTATDAGSLTLNLTATLPSISMDLIAGDNYLNANELSNGNVSISGRALNLPLGARLEIVIVDAQLTTTTIYSNVPVSSDGAWNLSLSSGLFSADGSYTITVTSPGIVGPASTQTVIVDRILPALSLDPFAADGLVNITEKAMVQAISGLSDMEGSRVSITLNGRSYSALVIGGKWSVNVPTNDMAALGNGSYEIKASISDAAGNTTEKTQTIIVDSIAPVLSVAAGLPAVLTTLNIGTGIVLQGTGDKGNSVNVDFLTTHLSGTVDALGNWKVTLDASLLKSLGDGPLSIAVSTTDAAGNTTTKNVSLNIELNPSLGVVFNKVTDDNLVNLAESLATQTLTGKITGNALGAKVSLTIAGIYTVKDISVAADGTYSIELPPSIWTGLMANTLALRVDVTDSYGNTTFGTTMVNLAIANLPAISNVLVTKDNVINLLESGSDQVISGVVSQAANVKTLVLNLGGQTIQATVNAQGGWTASLPTDVLKALPDGTATVGVTITDTSGNVINTSASFNVVTHNLPVISLDTLFSNGILSIPELAGALLSGTATNLAGKTLTIQVGTTTAFTTNVDGTGHWSVNLPDTVKTALQQLGTGSVSITITGTDQYENTVSQTGSIKLDLVAPVLQSMTLFGDNLLNLLESQTSQTIVGTLGNAPIGSTVQVTIGSKIFSGTVNTSTGGFTITLSPSVLASLADGISNTSITVTTPDGNTATLKGPDITVGLKNLPVVAITSLFGNDGYLNHAEAIATQTISGTVTGLADGVNKVKVTVNGTDYLADLSGGNWTLSLPAGTLSQIKDGVFNVTASVVDAVNNTVTGSKTVNAIVQAVPSLHLNTLFGDGTLDLIDLLTNPVLSGTSSNVAVGTQIMVSVGTLNIPATIGANGLWQITLTAASLQNLQDGSGLKVSVTMTDAAGNVASDSQQVTVAIQATPSVTITSLFGDNLVGGVLNGGLNSAESKVAQTISGISQNAIGSQVKVLVAGVSYFATVAADGTWAVSVPSSALTGLSDGQQSVSVSVTNSAGKVASDTSALNVILHTPTISVSTLFGDGKLNINEANGGQLISGTITNATAGSVVTVTVGGASFNGTVNSNGTWTASISNTVLKALQGNTATITYSVTDRVGNTDTKSTDVAVKLTQPDLVLTAVPLAVINGLLGLVGGLLGSLGLTKPAILTLSGTSHNLEAGSLVNINLANLAFGSATVKADGTWSTDLNLGLDLVKILSLSTIVYLSAADSAGNMAYLNVGLGGGNPTITPPPGTSTLMTEAASFSVLAASANEGSDNSSQTSSDSSNTTTTTAATHETATTTDTTTTETTYTIGGLSVDLADGTTQTGDTVHGGTGNDTIHLSSLGFTEIDGGAGTDTLVLDGSNIILNLIELAGKVHNIEVIDLGKSGNNSITLDVNEALTITDKPEDDLLIKGSDGDQINLKHGATDTWAITEQREVNGVMFDVYHNSSQSNTLSDVLIQHGLHVNMV